MNQGFLEGLNVLEIWSFQVTTLTWKGKEQWELSSLLFTTGKSNLV